MGAQVPSFMHCIVCVLVVSSNFKFSSQTRVTLSGKRALFGAVPITCMYLCSSTIAVGSGQLTAGITIRDNYDMLQGHSNGLYITHS